ncbi:Signal transduction histidine kinase CheA [Myxococcus hansupus]|uniref:histidine kinase n=1 Tax=Pseudomyxococcus hansupus TaxID=1297742 RepID=A0A0H4XBE0_9BACT|nr:chemotaxis protein CheA [Myxococcus hansupus]AKQ65222.1 Signal transduction histidine kinase CheA [Myxococcus hansupus]
MNPGSKALAEFVAEATEILDALARDLLVLDERRGQEADPDLVNGIFRAAHSLKGLSGLFGQERISRLAHGTEDLLDRLRLGKLLLDGAVLDALIEALDAFQALLGEAARGTETEGLSGRVDVMAARLASLGAPTEVSEDDPLDRLELEAQVRSVFTEYEEHRLRENVRRGVALWRVRAAFDLSDFDKGLAELNARLKPLGEVISTLPSAQPGGAHGIAFDLIFGGQVDSAALAAGLEGTPAELAPLVVRPAVDAVTPALVRAAQPAVTVRQGALKSPGAGSEKASPSEKGRAARSSAPAPGSTEHSGAVAQGRVASSDAASFAHSTPTGETAAVSPGAAKPGRSGRTGTGAGSALGAPESGSDARGEGNATGAPDTASTATTKRNGGRKRASRAASATHPEEQQPLLPHLSEDAAQGGASEGVAHLDPSDSGAPASPEVFVSHEPVAAPEVTPAPLVAYLQGAAKAAPKGLSVAPAPSAPGAGSAPASTGSGPAAQTADTSLRSLTQTVRVDIGRLDGLINMVGELLLIKANLQRLAESARQDGAVALSKLFGQELARETRGLERKLEALQEGLLEARMVPVGQVFDKLARLVRRITREAGKEIEFVISGGEVELDKLIVEELSDPLMHLIRNAIDHGVESPDARLAAGKSRRAVVSLRAEQKGNHVVIEVSDDGAGIDEVRVREVAITRGLITFAQAQEMSRRELLNLIFQPGFSTARSVSELSGRGVGLDVVKNNLGNLSGIIDVWSERGKGTSFHLTLPVTLAIIRALLVGVSGRTYAVPLNSVLEIISVQPRDIRTVERREVLDVRGQTLPFVRLARMFALPDRPVSRYFVVVVGLAQERLGIAVDELHGQQDIVTKPLGGRLQSIRGISGATDLGNRRTVLVLDVAALLEEGMSPERRRA